MPKYQVIKDIKVIDFVLLKVGDDIELNEGEPLKMNTPFGFLELSFESIQSSLKEKETIEVSITELEDEYEVDYYPHLILANKGILRHYPGATMIRDLYESII